MRLVQQFPDKSIISCLSGVKYKVPIFAPMMLHLDSLEEEYSTQQIQQFDSISSRQRTVVM